MNFQRSRSGGDDPARRDRKKGKQKRRGGIESPEDLSPTKKNKRHNRYLHPTKYQMNIRIYNGYTFTYILISILKLI